MSQGNYLSDDENKILFMLFDRLELSNNFFHWAVFICNDKSIKQVIKGHLLKEVVGYKCFLCDKDFYFENVSDAEEKQKTICQHGREHIKQSNLMPFI